MGEIRYGKLLSPIKIGNVVLKNRMTSTPSTPHFLQGVENYPTEKWITHFANRAKNGAAVVTINHLAIDGMAIPGIDPIDNMPGHFNMIDMKDTTCQNYLCQLVDAIHYYGAKAMGYLPTPDIGMLPPREDDEDEKPPKPSMGNVPPMPPMPSMGKLVTVESMTEEDMIDYIEEIVSKAVILKKLGFDMFSIHSAYGRCIHSQFLSPKTNHRTDEYGGSVENRSRFVLRIYKALKEACGKQFPLEIVMSVSEPGGWTVEDSIAFAKLAEGTIDIMHLRGGITDPQHPTGFTSTLECQMPYLLEIAQVKKACVDENIQMVIGASSGFHDLDLAEKALKENQADLICMARSWINDPEYGKKAYEGRGEDVVPCIRCNRCHGSDHDYFRSVCSVNPLVGLEDKIDRMNTPSGKCKRVAVIGGGPAGMEAALVAAKNGHHVYLYEKQAQLGGALKHADYASFKWPLKQYKDYLIQQLYKQGVRVSLNTEVSKEFLEHFGFESIIVAIGSVPNIPNITGSHLPHVHTAQEIYGKTGQLGKQIVVIGGGEIGVETGLYLAEADHEVMVLEMGELLAPDAVKSHYRSMLVNYYKKQENFHWTCNATCMEIKENAVVYKDKEGNQSTILADDIVLSVGVTPNDKKAMELFGIVADTHMIGDCETAGNVQKAIRSAYAVASQI